MSFPASNRSSSIPADDAAWRPRFMILAAVVSFAGIAASPHIARADAESELRQLLDDAWEFHLRVSPLQFVEELRRTLVPSHDSVHRYPPSHHASIHAPILPLPFQER